jgi:hypothetical protein
VLGASHRVARSAGAIPNEAAEAVTFLVSDTADYLTGAPVPVDRDGTVGLYEGECE